MNIQLTGETFLSLDYSDPELLYFAYKSYWNNQQSSTSGIHPVSQKAQAAQVQYNSCLESSVHTSTQRGLKEISNYNTMTPVNADGMDVKSSNMYMKHDSWVRKSTPKSNGATLIETKNYYRKKSYPYDKWSTKFVFTDIPK